MEKIIKLIQHEIAICDKLDKEYRGEWLDAVGKGDEVGARVLDDLRIQIHGEKIGYKKALEFIGGAK